MDDEEDILSVSVNGEKRILRKFFMNRKYEVGLKVEETLWKVL